MDELIQRVSNLYADFGGLDLEALHDVYCEDVEFVDPVHSIRGIERLKAYFAKGQQGLLSCRFDYGENTRSETSFCLEWRMRFSHRRLKGGSEILVPGISHIKTRRDPASGLLKVARHVDYYDMGELLYEHIPLLGSVVRRIKQSAG